MGIRATTKKLMAVIRVIESATKYAKVVFICNASLAV
jgi:hypothetical protein